MINWFSKNKNKIYDNKIDALTDANDIELVIDSDYGYYDYDWTVEPKDDWKTLLKHHAQYLRDTNKKIRIWYSGGVDSQTVLNTFLENNIYIDEIATWRCTATNDFENALHPSEVNRVAIPFLNSIRHKIPNTRINVYDLGYEDYYLFIDKYFKYDLYWSSVSTAYNQPLYRPDLFSIDDEHMNISGGDKPRVFNDDQGYYFMLNDNMFFGEVRIPGSCFKHYKNFFYSSREIYAKQCHVVMDYLKENKESNKSTTDITNELLRSKLFVEYSVGKSYGESVFPVLAAKALSDYLACKKDKEKYILAELFEKRYLEIDLPLNYFNNNNKLAGLIGVTTKKFRLE